MLQAKWKTLALSTVLLVILWLTITGKLSLFIHPRYNMFTLITVIIALGVLVITLFLPHEHSHEHQKTSRFDRIVGSLTVMAAFAMIFIAPQALSYSLAANREINGGVMNSSQIKINSQISSKNYKEYQVKDWAILTQSSAKFAYSGKKVQLSGFIQPIDESHYYVSRFVVYCCTVDAQPVGVVVYEPNWNNKYQKNQWVKISGTFVKQNQVAGYQQALEPTKVTKIQEPEIPYEY